jgi:hypothetical protein
VRDNQFQRRDRKYQQQQHLIISPARDAKQCFFFVFRNSGESKGTLKYEIINIHYRERRGEERRKQFEIAESSHNQHFLRLILLFISVFTSLSRDVLLTLKGKFHWQWMKLWQLLAYFLSEGSLLVAIQIKIIIVGKEDFSSIYLLLLLFAGQGCDFDSLFG